MRERLLAVIRGEPHDRVPFIMYDGILPKEEVWKLLGRERIGLLRWCGPARLETPHCQWKSEKFQRNGSEGERQFLITPKGTLTKEVLFEPVYHSAATHKHFVAELKDYDLLDEYLRGAEVVLDRKDYDRACAELRDDGLPLLAVKRTAWQQLWVEWVNIQDLAWHFAEHEDRVLATAALLEKINRAYLDCACRLKPVFVDFPDNITAPMIGRAQFQRFCVPLYKELSARLAESGAYTFCHMDGDLAPLWDLIGSSGLRGLDSMSPPPDNDTSVGQALAMWPQMRIFINFPSSVHLQDPSGIRAVTREILAQGANSGRLEIQLSENVPPGVWRTSLPVIAEEIEASGRPRV
ncbi:MAG: uroporphyrinogen decarboxylase family protein [Planctomycetota bacterium]